MKGAWQRLTGRFDALSQRERGISAAAAVGGVLLLGYSLLIEPIGIRNRGLQQSIARQSSDLAQARLQLASQEALLRIDPDAGKKAEIARLKQALLQTDQQLATLESSLVSPERMNAVLENLLRRHSGLRLVGFKTLPPAALLDPPAGKGEARTSGGRDFNVFRHGAEIQLEGSFAELYAYLTQLEQGPQKFLWGEMQLTVVEHPRSRLTLVVYTLSSDKAWLII